jgi:glycerol-3-phosphate dehydrogenase (NAD(P)+)
VVEGVQTTATIYKLAKQLKVRMPITQVMYAVLYENLAAKEAVKALLTSEAGEE